MRETRRGKQKGAGAPPEMASGTLPLLRRFGSRHDELITRDERAQEGERCRVTEGLTATPMYESSTGTLSNQARGSISYLLFLEKIKLPILHEEREVMTLSSLL